jgi:hypothetical protein
VEEDAAKVRTIFRHYLGFGSLDLLLKYLRKHGIVTKVQRLKSGRTIGGIPFTRGPLSYLLRNRFFVGEVVYKGEVLPGPQVPILDKELFEAVQAKLAEQQNNHVRSRLRSEALLIGKIYDDRGHRMSPSHSRKRAVRYRYYISLPLLDGRPEEAGSVSRVPAGEIERVIAAAVRRDLSAGADISERDLITEYVTRAEVRPNQISIQIKRGDELKAVQCPWRKGSFKQRRELLPPACGARKDPRPIRADARARLVAALSRSRRWLAELLNGTVTSIEQIAQRERCSARNVNMILSLAFLAPDLVKAGIEGRLPRGIGIARLCDLPASWSEQFQRLGIAQPRPD